MRFYCQHWDWGYFLFSILFPGPRSHVRRLTITRTSAARLNIPTHDDPLSSQTQIPEFMDREIILRENDKVSRASRCFESDLSRFSEKVEASRTASFRDQEIFPIFYKILTLVPNFRDFSHYALGRFEMLCYVMLCYVIFIPFFIIK